MKDEEEAQREGEVAEEQKLHVLEQLQSELLPKPPESILAP